jgi:hypothetical protein
VKEFFKTHVNETDKEQVKRSFTITKIKGVSSSDIFNDWVEALYGIRNAFAHEVNYICQVFTDSHSLVDEVYEYRNCEAIYKIEEGKKIYWLQKFETKNFSFLISRQPRTEPTVGNVRLGRAQAECGVEWIPCSHGEAMR